MTASEAVHNTLIAIVFGCVFWGLTGSIYAGSDPVKAPAMVTAPQSALSQDADRKDYSAKVAAQYDFRFVKDQPFLPGNAQVEGEGFIQPGAFPSAVYCAHCHQEAYHQWRQALHSNAFRTPFYRTSVNILSRTRGIEFSRHCDSCHNPIGLMAGALTSSSLVDRKFDQDGVTCTVCHSILHLQSTRGNGGYVMGVPSVMLDEKGNRIPGEVPYDMIMKNTKRHARAVMQDFYRTPEYCAACHKANVPQTLNDYKFVPAFSAYDEWQNSKFSQRNPLTFYTADLKTCQGCHMKRNPLTLPDYGAKHGTLVSHRWLAGNTAVPFYYGFDEQLKKTIEFLQSGNYLNVDIFGLKESDENKLIAPLGTIPFSLRAKSVLQAFVVIQNKDIGHSLIPEVRDLYQCWVEFTVHDATGKEIYHSGFIKPDGMLDERAHSFTNRPVNVDGDFVDNHKVWTIHSVAYDNTIQAGRSALVRYQFPIPTDLKGPITLTAEVNYRHLRQSYLNNVLGKDHPAYPIVELASRSRTLNIGENAPTPPQTSDNPDWMRWNNFGIALLDQLQYSEAVAAFGEVVKLRPNDSDGYVNIALTEIQWEKYGSARSSIEKALALSPNSARALYYDALLERRAGNYQAETEKLKSVIARFPQSRDARRDLGVAYYREHNYEAAMVQFEALQKIDPDDVSAHYNLSLLYQRMGKRDQAAAEQARFIDLKVDPGAPTYSLDYLRLHPEISLESIPWHVHTDMTDATHTARQGSQ